MNHVRKNLQYALKLEISKLKNRKSDIDTNLIHERNQRNDTYQVRCGNCQNSQELKERLTEQMELSWYSRQLDLIWKHQ